MRSEPEVQDMLPLTPVVFQMLLALADGEKHGYGIMKAVEDETRGTMVIRIGTLYGSIKRMIASGLIEESEERPDPALDDERRRYYRLTPFGQRVLTAEAQRLVRLVRVARAKRVIGKVAT